jgi:hypothetical protein
MKYLLVVVGLFFFSLATAQNTVTSGNWSDPSVWSGGAVPAVGGTVNVNNPLTVDTNLSPTGTWTFNSNTADQPGGTAYTFNPDAGTNTITVSAGVTVTFGGGTAGTPNSFNSGTISIFGTLILGYTDLNNSGNLNITIQSGGTLIINGNLRNGNNSGTFTINGALIVNGDFDNQTGSVTVAGSGSIEATGTITSNGGSTVFGTTNDCTTPPCSGTTLNCTFANAISPTSKTICSGTTAGTLTANTTGTTPTYQWLSSTDNISYSNASGTSTNATYATPTLTQTTWYKMRKTVSGCTSNSAAMKVTVLSGGGWLGTTNNWGTASNWCSNAVPTSSTDVTISNASDIANMPVVNTGTSATCRNLTISNTFPASSITIAASATASLSISGDFTNNGIFSDNSTAAAAGVRFTGTTAQTISGVTANVFNNLTIANTSGVIPAVNLTFENATVNSNLTMTSGVTNLNGFAILLGTAAASPGTLAYTNGWFYGGNLTRWFPATAIAIGAVAGQFPIGTVSNYRPLYLGNAGLSADGTIKVRHTSNSGATSVSFADGGSTVVVRSNSFWTVSTANGLGTGTHNLRTEGTGFGTVGAVTDLRQTLTGSVVGTAGTNSGTTTNPQVNRTGLSTANLANNFYWGSINATQTPLPVTLSSFKGRQVQDYVELKWATASELNFDFFSVEKSLDGIDFFEIGKVKGNGTTQQMHQYSLQDTKALIGKNYYRLKSVDLDGYEEYFTILMVDFFSSKHFFVSPNPSTGDYVQVSVNFFLEDNSSVKIYGSNGLLVGTYLITSPDSTIYFASPLVPGVYFAKLSSSHYSEVIRLLVME